MQPGGTYFLGAPLKRGCRGDPLNFLNIFFYKKLPKSVTKNDVLFAELGATVIFAKGIGLT